MTEDLRKSILEILRNRAMHLEDIVRELRLREQNISISEIVNALQDLKNRDLIEQIRNKNFSPARPITTSLWKAKNIPHSLPPIKKPAAASEDESVVLSASTPLLNLMDSKKSLIPILDAVSMVIISAEHRLYIATPYVDATLSTMVTLHYQKLSQLDYIRVLVDVSEKNISLLERLKTILPNLEYKVLGEYKQVSGTKAKVMGLHLKAVVADEKVALIGTFNFKEHHITANYDLALIVRGQTAKDLWNILDTLWNSANKRQY